MILRDIAQMIAQCGTTPAEIAARLRITPEQLAGRLSLMERQGYLEREQECSSRVGTSCGCCHCSSRCRETAGTSSPQPIRYVLTGKGRKLASGTVGIS
ncbi:MAG: helix-turn-helix domain-containing protein [Methanoregulaceae archaeon]